MIEGKARATKAAYLSTALSRAAYFEKGRFPRCLHRPQGVLCVPLSHGTPSLVLMRQR